MEIGKKKFPVRGRILGDCKKWGHRHVQDEPKTMRKLPVTCVVVSKISKGGRKKKGKFEGGGKCCNLGQRGEKSVHA